MPALVPAPFPPHSFYAIWALCSFAGSESTAARIARIARPSLSPFRYGLPHQSSHATTSNRHCRFQFMDV
ncbi:hypothetical protein DPMN_119141 [Dreissena polymorpha]|uniref:Uncharacterized protein n=1 Tax=Dreissena polymorpha TaxID=45954 RepID=A0A9D4GIR5_DREPO|nr:hypothetical protein DPMN_119141 [Dreissena polymorpha]